MSKFIACSFWINSLKKLRKKLGNQNKQAKWLNVLNEEVPFSGPKSAKTRPKFFSQKTPQFGNFLVENDSPYQFLLHFYVIIFSKYPKSNNSQRFFNTFTQKISFGRFFLILLSAPNLFGVTTTRSSKNATLALKRHF